MTEDGRHAAGEATRERIVVAARRLFGEKGYAGTSTRDIAAAAGVHQPQVAYHFGNKEGLWEACVDSLFEALRRRIELVEGDDPETIFRGLIRAFVAHAAEHPELHRILVWESAQDGERIRWLVERHIRPRVEGLRALAAHVESDRLRSIPADSLYYIVIGGATSPFVSAPEYRLLFGVDPDEMVERHARTIEELVLGPPDR